MTTETAGEPITEGWDLRDFVENAPVGMHETGAGHRILWANRAELTLLGYAADEYVGHAMADFFEDPAEFQRLMLRLKQLRSLENQEARLRCRDGSICPVSVNCNLYGDSRDGYRVRYVVRNLEDLSRSELELQRKRAEIETLNQRLRRAMSETHHRVKNNLQIIAALVDMQLMANDGLIPANELRRLEHHIHALAAIHDLLTQQARKDPALESISVKETLEVLRPLVQEMVNDRQVRFDVQDVQLPVRQETAVALLVNELVGNAARFGRGPIDLRLGIEGGGVTLEVSDQGSGFPAGFDASRFSNTGLELVEAVSHWDLQGSTAYTNLPGGGARVTVKFPIQPAAPYGC